MLRPPHLILFVASLFLASAAAAASLPIPSGPNLSAKSDILLDYQSGQVLVAKNADERIEPASVTKLMTAYIVFDEIKKGHLSLDDEAIVSEKSWKMHGSQMFLKVGDKVTIDDLLDGLITTSGNDAAVSLAEYVAGTASAFVQYMNQYARALGLSNSHFMDVNGLPHEQHFMSAHNMATLYADLVRNFPQLYDQYFHEKSFTYNGIKQYNRNSLLWSDPRVDGGKTGHTESAGYNLVASGEANGMRMICVVTGTSSAQARARQCEALLNYGFRFYANDKLFDAGQAISQVRVWKGSEKELPVVADGPVYIAYPRGHRKGVSVKAKLPDQLTAPVEKGAQLGELKISYEDKMLKNQPLYAGQAIDQGGIVRRLVDDVLMRFH